MNKVAENNEVVVYEHDCYGPRITAKELIDAYRQFAGVEVELFGERFFLDVPPSNSGRIELIMTLDTSVSGDDIVWEAGEHVFNLIKKVTGFKERPKMFETDPVGGWIAELGRWLTDEGSRPSAIVQGQKPPTSWVSVLVYAMCIAEIAKKEIGRGWKSRLKEGKMMLEVSKSNYRSACKKREATKG